MLGDTIGVDALSFELLEVLLALDALYARQELLEKSQIGSIVDR